MRRAEGSRARPGFAIILAQRAAQWRLTQRFTFRIIVVDLIVCQLSPEDTQPATVSQQRDRRMIENGFLIDAACHLLIAGPFILGTPPT